MDVIVIGGGVNGLVAGGYLARHKKKVLILERQPSVGGAAITPEIAPGFRVPSLSHAIGPIAPIVFRSLRIDKSKLHLITPDPVLTTLGRDGKTISFHRDAVLTAASIDRLSPPDAGRWREFLTVTQRIASVIAAKRREAPPPIDAVAARDLWRLLAHGRRARALGKRDLARAIRWTPMAVADLTGEWFQNDLLQAAIAAHAVFGHFAGPWSAGTGGLLLQRIADDPMPVGSGMTLRGGPGALAAALAEAATKAGATIRTGARVTRILTRDGRVTGVALDNGDEIPATTVVAAIDPKLALISLLDPVALAPTLAERVRHLRMRGVTAKINLALSGLPAFSAFAGDAVPLRGRLLIAPDLDYLERGFDAAKYGAFSPAPWLEIAVPSVADPSLAPEGQHVMSICVHFAPRRLRDAVWADRKDALYRSVMDVLAQHTRGLEAQIVGAEIITPEDIEERWGTSGGHIFHGEMTLDQSWIARPALGLARYRTPIEGLVLASAGAHPGGGLTGLPGLLGALHA